MIVIIACMFIQLWRLTLLLLSRWKDCKRSKRHSTLKSVWVRAHWTPVHLGMLLVGERLEYLKKKHQIDSTLGQHAQL